MGGLDVVETSSHRQHLLRISVKMHISLRGCLPKQDNVLVMCLSRFAINQSKGLKEACLLHGFGLISYATTRGDLLGHGSLCQRCRSQSVRRNEQIFSKWKGWSTLVLEAMAARPRSSLSFLPLCTTTPLSAAPEVKLDKSDEEVSTYVAIIRVRQ